jgi:hypothetical protein
LASIETGAQPEELDELDELEVPVEVVVVSVDETSRTTILKLPAASASAVSV